MKKKSIESLFVSVIVIFFLFFTSVIIRTANPKEEIVMIDLNGCNGSDRPNDSHFPPGKYFQNALNVNEKIFQCNIKENNSLKEISFPDSYSQRNGDLWPMFAHDIGHSGRSNYSTINTTNIEKWRFPTSGTVWGSSPVIDTNGVIYFADEGLYAIYSNGTLKWKYGSFICETTPVIDNNGTIYVGTSHGSANGIYAFSLNGTLKWIYGTGNHVESSPAIGNDGTIYFGDCNGYITALYSNGTLKWRYKTGMDIYSSPAIGKDGIIYCGSHDNKLYAIYPTDGTVKWNFSTGNWVHGSPTIGTDGTIYIGSDDGFLYALNPENGSMIWKCNVGSMFAAPALDEDGTLYFGVWESAFKAVYPNGTLKWSFDLGSHNGVWGSSAAISADGSIYFGTFLNDGTGGGDLIVLNLNGTEKWRSRIGSSFIWSSPAIAQDGTVYIGADNGYIHAFGPGEPKQINLQEPKTGHLYLFNHDVGTTIRGNTIVINSVTLKVNVSSIQDILTVDFYVGYYAAENPIVLLKFSDSEPPFEWTLNEYIGNNHHPFLPFDKCCIQIVGRYKGGCEWNDAIPKFWYFHLLKG